MYERSHWIEATEPLSLELVSSTMNAVSWGTLKRVKQTTHPRVHVLSEKTKSTVNTSGKLSWSQRLPQKRWLRLVNAHSLPISCRILTRMHRPVCFGVDIVARLIQGNNSLYYYIVLFHSISAMDMTGLYSYTTSDKHNLPL